MKRPLTVSAIVTVASFLAVCPAARPFGPDPEPARKIAHLRLEIIALDASLITLMSQAENSISQDVESLHACIVAEHTETIDTAAAYHEAKSLIRDLDALRKRAIADLKLPSTYTPPDVVAEPLPVAMTDLRPALEASYQDVATATRLMVGDIEAPELDIEKRLEILATEENISVGNMLRIEMMLNQLSQLSEATTNILSTSNSAIASMARNAK